MKGGIMRLTVLNALTIAFSLSSTPTMADNLADSTITVVNTGSPQRPLYALAMEQDGSGVAVGGLGTVLVTEDGGHKWSQKYLDTGVKSSNVALAILDVAVQGDRWLVVGQQGLIRYSDDRGESWTAANEPTEKRLMAVSSNESGVMAAVGENGTALLSGDGGEQWDIAELGELARSEEGTYAHFYDVHVADSGIITVVGEYGVILRSPDSGQTWERVRDGSDALFAIEVCENGEAYVVGQDGTVAYSKDNGITWQNVETGATGVLLDIHASADGMIVVPGMRTFLITLDNGESWDKLVAEDLERNWYNAIAQGPHGLLVAGHSERVLLVQGARRELSMSP